MVGYCALSRVSAGFAACFRLLIWGRLYRQTLYIKGLGVNPPRWPPHAPHHIHLQVDNTKAARHCYHRRNPTPHVGKYMQHTDSNTIDNDTSHADGCLMSSSCSQTASASSAIFSQYANGHLTGPEALDRLDAIGIRGAFTQGEFLGYDYINQCWIDTATD